MLLHSPSDSVWFICFIISYTELFILLTTIQLILSIKCLYFSSSLADTALFKEGCMIMMLKRYTLVPQRAKVGLRGWGGVQSVRVIDLRRGDMHGRSQLHTCMILTGGQAAGHPHIWEMDTAVCPSHCSGCGTVSGRGHFHKMVCWSTASSSLASLDRMYPSSVNVRCNMAN